MPRSSAQPQLAFDETLVDDPTVESALEERLARKVVLDKVRKERARGSGRVKRVWPSLLVAVVFVAIAATARAGDGCRPEPLTAETPTGVAGCEVYGSGTASMWGGPGVARNDCVYPWTGCQAIAIRSLQTGIVIIVTPSMFGDLYTGTPDERIVDLDPAAVAALGLDPADGLWPVEVWPIDPASAGGGLGPGAGGGASRHAPGSLLPDTAVVAP